MTAPDAHSSPTRPMPVAFGRDRRWWLLLFGSLGVIALMLVSFACWLQSQRAAEVDRIEARLSSAAEYRVAMVETWLNERRQDVRMVADFPSVSQLLRESASQPLATSLTYNHVASVLDLVLDANQYLSFIVLDRAGREVGGSTGHVPLDSRLRPVIERVLATGQPADGDAWRNADGRFQAWFVAPVLDPGRLSLHREVFGVLVLVADPKEHLYPILQKSGVLGETGQAVLVRRDGPLLVPLSPLGPSDREEEVQSVLDPFGESGANRIDEGFVETEDYAGHKVFASAHRVRGLPWMVVAKVDEDEALENHRREVRWVFLSGLVLILALIGLMRGAWRIYQRRYKEDLTARERRYVGLFEHIQDAVAIVAEGGRVVQVNPAAARMWGYASPDAVVGRSVREFYTKDSLPVLKSLWVSPGPGVSAPTTTGLLTGVRADGSTFPVEVRVSSIPWEGGWAVAATGRDVAERRRSEGALQRYQVLAENTRDIILFVGDDGRIVEANRAAVDTYGYPQKDLIGLEAGALRFPGQEPEVKDRLAEARQGEILYETTHRRKDGSTFPVEISARGVRIGGETLVLAVIRDITERKRLEQQSLLAQRLESLGRLAGGVAHDFNNLLTAIRGYAALVEESLPEGDPRRPDLVEVVKASDRASNLTKQLLAFSRHQATETRPVALNSVVAQTQKLLRRLIGEDIELTTLLTATGATVRADPAQIENLLVNLVVNSRDAMPDGGRIVIETANVIVTDSGSNRPDLPPGEYIRLSVRDTGSGMTDEVKARAFEPFFTTKGPGKGTGLGLSTCYGIVRQHEGFIRLESAPGKGTVVEVDLPRVRTAVMAAMPEARQERKGGNEEILLVEDDSGVRSYTARVLRDLGYRVIETASGPDALAFLADRADAKIDLLVTDVVMPRMSGVELRDKVRALRPEVRVLFMSGYNEVDVFRVGGVERGAAVVRKPFTAATLASRVRAVLDGGPEPSPSPWSQSQEW